MRPESQNTTSGDPTLHQLSREGQTQKLRRMLEGGADVNTRDDRQRTPLHHASSMGKVDIASLLLDRGADPNAVSVDALTPLHLASMRDHGEMVGLLLRRGARVGSKTKQGLTALHLAASENVVKRLVEGGADINAQSDQGLSPLHTARQSGVARALLDRGADLRIRTPRGQTAMELASVESLEQTGGIAIHSVMLGRLRGLLGQMPLALTNITDSPMKQVAVTASSAACSITVTPTEIQRIAPGERVDLTLTMTRDSEDPEGEHRVDLVVLTQHKRLGQIDLRIDTRMRETPEDQGMIRLAKGNLRPAPSRWHYLAYISVPLWVVLAWWLFRRHARNSS